jgi:predicted DNA-binding transcriptional regulator AlpA
MKQPRFAVWMATLFVCWSEAVLAQVSEVSVIQRQLVPTWSTGVSRSWGPATWASALYARVKNREFPAQVKLSARSSAWPHSEVLARAAARAKMREPGAASG